MYTSSLHQALGGTALLCTGCTCAEKLETMGGSSCKVFLGPSGSVCPLKLDGGIVFFKNLTFNGKWIQESFEGIPQPTHTNTASLSTLTINLKTEGLDQKGGITLAVVERRTRRPAQTRGVEAAGADSGPPEDTHSKVHSPVM